jgi:hypothetical protein
MQSRPLITSISTLSGTYDLLICAVGFEARAIHFARTFQATYRKGIALAFSERKVLHFGDNLMWYQQAEFEIHEFNGELRGAEIITNALKIARDGQNDNLERRVLVDISSMSRPMVADIVTWFSQISICQQLDVAFIYCPSKYVELGDQIYSMSYIGPVTPSFAGWINDTKRRLVAIVGLGGERGLALGAVEYLEATDVWAFLPGGVDSNYDAAAEKANSELLERIGPSRVVKYDPRNAFDCFCALEALAYGLLQRDRPILLPFGPKIFATTALLVAQFYKPRIPVWRVSGEQSGDPVDREANGAISVLGVKFEPPKQVV